MTICPVCSKELRTCEEVHAVDGLLFCSKECAIIHITNDIVLNAKAIAIETYNDNAEVVATADILSDEIELGGADE